VLNFKQNSTMSENQKVWKPTEEAKGKATQLRLFAALLWVGAITAQVAAIIMLRKQGENFMAWVIGLIVVDLILAILGSILWKKSNRLDPASEKNGFLFFMQSQLGLVVAVIAFLPLVIVILTNKNISGKQKAILGSIAGIAMVIAGISGADFNPPSIEKYTEETNLVEALTGANNVYYTKGGGKYHVYEDCYTIKNSERLNGTVAEAHAGVANHSNFDLCGICKNKKMKEDGLSEETLNEKLEQVKAGLGVKTTPNETE
jgi:hypothetical protein